MLNGISAVTTGQIHINQGRECEDYTELDLERKDYVMTAVADGHSSQKHFRSDRGSQFAAEAAKERVNEQTANRAISLREMLGGFNSVQEFIDMVHIESQYSNQIREMATVKDQNIDLRK